jgi:hypothetical protein
MDKGSIIIITSLVFFFIGLLAILFMTSSKDKPCERYRNYSVNELPVRCLKYYGIEGK